MSAPLYPQPQLDLKPASRRVRVGAANVDLATHTVTRAGLAPVRLSPKAAHVLLVLLMHHDRPVHREHLIAQVWPGQFRTDDVVTKAMQELRRALSDSPEQAAIETIPRVGYWLKLPIVWIEDDAPGQSTDAGSAVDAPAEPQLAITTAGKRRAAASMVILAALVLVATLMFSLWNRGITETPAPQPQRDARASLAEATSSPALSATPLSTDPGDEAYAAIAADGKLVAIALKGIGEDRYRLHLRDVANGADRLLLANGTGDELAPIWSRDGRQLAYFRIDGDDCTLEVVDVLGLAPRKLARCVSGVTIPVEFFPDGSSLLVPWLALADRRGNGGFARIEIDTGRQSNFDYGSAPAGFELEARFSPDGTKLLVQQGLSPFSSVRVHALDGRDAQPAPAIGERFSVVQGMTWLPDNRTALIASNPLGVIELMRLDTQSGAIERFGGLVGQFPSAARSADLIVYTHLDRQSGLLRLGNRKNNAPISLFPSTRSESSPALSADGKQLAFVSDRMGSAQIYLGDAEGRQATALGDFKSGRPFDLSFSSDGRQLAFGLRRDENVDIRIMDIATRKHRRPRVGVDNLIDLRFAAEPDQLLFASWDAEDRPHIYTQRMDDPQSARRLTECSGRAPRSGGDGWIYFFAPAERALKRVRSDAVNTAECDLVSDRVRWVNRNAWLVDGSGLYAVLTPLDRVARAGLYRLSEPPELLTELPELSRRPLANIELIGSDGQMIGAIPVAAAADTWMLRGPAPPRN